jgi:NitT/TauT family transport system substrate-binding protein
MSGIVRPRSAITLIAASIFLLALAIWAFSGDEQKEGDITLALDWFAQPSNAGAYTALARGYYRDDGLDVRIQPGGAQAMAIQVVASGRAQFGLETAAHILEARARGIPIVAIAATFQQSPAALFFHKGQAIRDFRDLNDRTVYTQVAAPQWAWQKRHYGLDTVRDLQFSGSYAAFAQDKRAVAQGYITTTTDELAAKGVATDHIPSVEDVGYASVLFTTEAMIRDQPEKVRDFVAATARGWADFRRDPRFTIATLRAHAGGRSEASLLKESERQQAFIWTGDALKHGWGWMTHERWAAAIRQAVAEGSIPTTDPDTVFTTRFLVSR